MAGRVRSANAAQCLSPSVAPAGALNAAWRRLVRRLADFLVAESVLGYVDLTSLVPTAARNCCELDFCLRVGSR